MIVVDTSAIMAALAGRPHIPELTELLARDADLHAPHLIDVEFLHALRRLVLTGQLSGDRADDARTDFADMSIIRYPHVPLADRIWALRDNVSAYDAAFVALAEVLDVPLITCDKHMARGTAHRAQVEVYTAR